MNPEELPADYEMQRALLDQARKNSSGQNDEINSIVERGQKLVEEGAMGVESAKAGRSAAGKFLVDLAVQATMMGGDMLLGLATGGGMAPLIARAYGGSVNEAIADGADYNLASLYGAAAAATEAFTERMFDGFAQVYGQGDSTKLVSYVSGKLAKTDAGRLAWQYIINGMGEGVEEVVSDLVNPLIKTIYNGKKLSQNYKELNIGDIAYDFIVGAALGYSGVAVEAIGGTGMSDTAKFFSDAAGNGMSFKEACKLYEAMWTAYDEWVSRETDGKNAGYTDTQNAAGVNSGLFAEEDIVEGTGEYVDAAENATNNAPTATEAEASGMTAEEYASVLEQSMQPVQQEADIQTEQQSTPAVQQVEQENDISSSFDPFYNGDVINAGAVEEDVQNGTFPVEAIESIPVDKDIRNDKTTTQEATQAQQEANQSVQSGSNVSAAPTQENASQKPQASAVAPVSAKKQRAISAAESYGERGVPFSLLVGDDMGTKLDSVRELTPKEREEAYLRGKKRAESKAQKQQGQRDAEANGNTGWRRGNVIGDGVKISDMKETFNDPQGLSYTILSTISEVTGIDIILYRSEAENGVFTMYEGKFKKSTDQIYLDLNSGLMRSMDADQLSKYVMLRTFGHEITHFDEKWSPVLYNEFRQAVFDHMEKNGTDVDALIREQQDNGMSYEAASREVVADAMTDVLPDSNFVEMLAKEHRTVFQRILDKLKEFVAKVKEAFAKMVPNNKAAANAVKENVDGTLRYAQNIVDLFDRMTVDAVERYQRARATKETVATPEEAVEADAGGTKETRTPVSLNSLIAKAETYADDQTGKEQLSQLIKDAYDRGKNRKRVTVDDILSGARDIVDTDTGKEQLAGLVAAAYLRGQSNAQNVTESDKTVNSELYKHFFEESTPEEAMDALKKVGFTRWQKNGKDRLYINADSLGLEITWGKRRGQVESASFQGEDISKSYASELRSAKTYVDVKTQEIIGTDKKLKEIATNLYMETLTKAYEDAVNSSTNAQPESESQINTPEGLRDALTKHDRATIYNFRFKISENGSGFILSIDDVADEDSVIKNARAIHARIPCDTRSEAVDAAVNNARGLSLFKTTTNGAAETPNNTNTEAKTNGEETERPGSGESPVRSDNVGAVPVSESDGEGASRLVDEREAGDVQRDGGRGNPASGAEEAGGPVRQSGYNVHEAGASGVRGEGTGESGLSDLNPAELEDRDRQQKSTEQPGGSNFIIGDSLNLPGGEKGKYKANVKALRLAHQIQTENRFATAEEQEALSKYVGWGGLSKAFGRLINASDRNNRNGYSPDAGWEKELDELWSLVDDGVITTAELRSMANSSTNAHYTSIEVVKAMWDGLRSLGFKGGRLMEPSCGTGNFVGGMPADMLPGVRSWTMVELDRVTGGIAKLLYPHADVKIQGFQDAKIPDNMLDVVIGNVPFGKSDFVDKRYPKNITDSLHDYFFIKSLDKVRPGGIVMMLTSMYTMDKKDSKVRDYIAARADLIGAVRLPNTAFIENAATSVVTDMLILKKRKPGTPYGGEAFVNLSNNRSQVAGAANYDYAYDYFLNEYFVNHPEMVLGTPDHGTMYGGRDEITYNPIKDGRTLRQQITDAISTIQARMEYPETVSAEKANVRVENAEKKGGTGSYQVKDGQLVKVDGGAVELSSEDQARMVGIVGIRNAYQNLVAALNNGYAPDVVSKARNELNAAYDSFVAKYGYINSQKNSKLIEDDPARYQLLALEVDYDKGNAKSKIPASARKADIFTKDTISPNVTIKSVDTVEEGIIASINVSGGIDPEYIGKLMGKTGEQMSELLDASEDVFRDDSGNFQYRERYLSGNVRAKLEKARYLAESDKRYEKNVRALEAVMPEDIPAGRVQSSVNIGARWIDTEYYTGFLIDRGIFNGSVYLNAEGYYDVTGRMSGPWAQSNSIKRKHGGTRTGWDAVSIFEKVLNGRQLVVYDTIEDEDGKKKSVVNKDDTQAAERIGNAMRSEFQEWLFEDKTRSEYLTKTFNEQFNSYVTPKYDGSKLTIKGLSPSITLRPHQKNAVQRMLMSGGNTLLAHCVGAGKTAVVASTVMKLREIGAIKRPLIICPKSLVAQWGTEFRKFFPTANILVADAKNFSKEKRAVFAANIRNGDYDAIVMSYQNFSEIPLSEAYLEEFKESLTNREIQSKIDDAISKGKGGLSAKKTASAEASLKKQLDGLMNLSKNALIPTFEEFGFDGIFVDEAHNFKNLWYKTNLQNVGGLGSGETKSAMDLYAKISYLQKLNGGRGVALVTATPVMNSIVEMYTMQRYLQGDLLKQLGITTFDAWAGMFGVTEKVWELNAAGNYTQKTVMAKYTNIPALMQLYGQIADTVTKIDAKIPERVDELVEIPMSHAQREYMKDLNERANNKENPLKLTGDGRKMAYSIHMVDETEGYEPGCKIYVAADKINEIYKKSTGVTVNDEHGNPIKVNGTQIVFLDMGVPKAKTSKTESTSETTEDFDDEETENATLYEALKRKLIEDGIPENEIAFIHDAKTDKQKEALRDSMNAGTTRVLIGSTGKMGVGMNAQRLCVALHNIDCPWRPGDLEQRIGRAIRQGNLFSNVEILQYATVGSFDSAMWSKVDRKAKMIQQVTSGEFVGDTFEADEGDALSYAQIAAISSGNPKILQLLNAQKQLEGYESAYRYYVSSRNSYLSEAEDSKRFAAKAEATLASLERAKEIIEKNPNYGEKFSIEIGGKKYIKAKVANKAFADALEANKRALFGKTIDIGTFCGLPITARIVDNKFNRDWEVSLGDISTRWASDVSDWATTFSNVVKGIDKAISAEKTKIETFKNAAEERTQLANKPFEGTEEWEAAKREVLALQEELGMLDRPNAVGDDEEGDEQYSLRNPESEEYMDYEEETEPDEQYLKRVTDKETLAALAKAESEGVKDWRNVKPGDLEGVVKVYRAMQAQPVDETGNVVPRSSVIRIVSTDPLMVEARVFGAKKSDPTTTAIYPAKLFSPMAGQDNGVWRNPINLNEWEMSEGHPEKAYHVIDKKTGKPKIDTNKVNASYGEVAYYFGLEKGGVDNNGKPKGDVPARYNPYIHTSLSALNDQFSSGNKRPELVTVESLVPLFHINTPYEERFRHPYAKDKVGAMSWHSGPTSSRLAKLDKARVVILSRYDKPIRVVPDDEVAKSIAQTIGDSENISIQESTVTPSIAAELRKLGVSVLNEADWGKYSEDYPVTYFSKAKKGGNKAKTVVPYETDEQYSRRSSSMTDRDLLEMAADMVDQSDYTDGEKDALRIFKERLTTLQELTEQREDMGKTYRAQQFGKPADRKGAEQTLARMKILDGRIEKARNAVLDVESKPVLRDVLSKSRNILEQQGKAATNAALNKLRAKTAESAGVKKYRKRIADDVADITKWITNPSNKSSLDRVPDAIKNPVIDFLNALDFTSKRALKGGAATKADAVVMARAKRLSEAMKKGFDLNEAYARYELPDDFFDRMDDFIWAADAYASAGEFTINEMTAQELKVLSGLVKSLKKFIRQVNRFHQNAIFEHVSEASQSSMEFMRELGEAKRDGNLDNFLLWQNIRPAYGFERFGRGGEAIWDELRRGQDKLAFNTVEISDFVKQTYTPEQVKEWSETVEVFEIGDEKEPVSIPVAYLMGLYELSKDPDGARHILEGGIRVAPFTVGKNRVTNNGVDMTQLSLSEMVDRLKKKYPEAAETADKMQRFMARTGGKMANEVSMARFGEEMFTNEKYYPISSDGRLFDVSADKPYDNQNLYALLNMSFTKNRIEGANNRVVIYNIFDVFSNHMSGVATYNALALPVLDTLKWLNYRETVINETGDVVKGERLTEVMDRTFGGGNDEAPGSNARGYATKFVLDIVRSYNGTTPQSSPIDRFAINALHHYNVAQVAFNGRVVIQQPLAIVRAGMYLNIGDITGAIASFRKGKAYYTEKRNEMLRNSGIAAWKDLGFYDVNISRGLTELIKQDDSKVDKLNDFGLKAAEAADSVTWTAIWVASEKAAERNGFTPDSERYMEEVVRIFEEVIYKTQVVDSVLTKTAWLRDKGAVARATGSFMNEPVTTYNLLVDAYDKFNMDKRRGMSNQQAWQKNGKRIARVALIYGLTALTNAMITAMADAWRDDDDYQTALEKWWEAFRGNIVDELIPFNKLPLVSEAYDLILMTLNKMGLDVAGYEPNSFLFQWSDDWLKAVEIISDKMKGEDTNYTWYAGIYYLLRAVSGMTAVPLGSITREVSDIWNNSVGALAPSLKLITYDPGVKNNIKYALWDGYLTEAEAADALVKAGIMNEADAREQARHWAYTNSNPDSTLTLTQLSNYDKYASPAGITIDEYENFLLSIKDYKGDTKKERIVAKINAMPVSARQKDAYFYAAGYKSSTLEQTPWHFDMSGWQIDDYKEYGAPAGIPKETFKTFTETASKMKGDDKNGDGKTDSGSKKAKVIAYIDELPLTPAQKDALYYQQGYAESKIGDTPWH